MKEVKSFKRPLLEVLFFLGFSILYFIISAIMTQFRNIISKLPCWGPF